MRPSVVYERELNDHQLKAGGLKPRAKRPSGGLKPPIGKSRADEPSTYETPRSTTKLGGMWEFAFFVIDIQRVTTHMGTWTGPPISPLRVRPQGVIWIA